MPTLSCMCFVAKYPILCDNMRDVLSFTVGLGTVHETLFCQCDCVAVSFPLLSFMPCIDMLEILFFLYLKNGTSS